jgi:peptidoglycan hydrolase-like protein with peptidoglycan-binding domain
LDVPLLDDYLIFLAGRCRPNTVLATAYDLKVFFTVVGKEPADVVAADVLSFVTAQRTGLPGPGRPAHQNPADPAPDGPPGTPNHQPAPRYDVDKTTKCTKTSKSTDRHQAPQAKQQAYAWPRMMTTGISCCGLGNRSRLAVRSTSSQFRLVVAFCIDPYTWELRVETPVMSRRELSMGKSLSESVLRVQSWLNTTYAGVSGFQPVAEDGVASWATMYALTRALQHELGISVLSDGFGPATLSALTQRGGVPRSEANANIVRIVQAGCLCKGYHAAELTGVFDLATSVAVSKMMVDAGLEPLGGSVPPKVVKALLTMGSYRLVQQGEPAVRAVQRWLNGRYLTHENVFVIPCDGVVSRSSATSLVFAVQFEMGLTDQQATGVVGALTRTGLKSQTLGPGASGVFVSLFSAGMILNQVDVPGHGRYRHFVDRFDRTLAKAVGAFQSFCALPRTEQGDFATWCQLLASNGDPDRPCAAVDCITTITDARAATLKAAGVQFVGRYLDERPSAHPMNKRIQPGELDVIFRNGLKVFPISQYFGKEVGYFTRDQGLADAHGAHDAAVGYGFDPATVIYFAVDYDATQAEIDSNVIPYFEGVLAGLAERGCRYDHGVYGSRNVCTQVTLRTQARWSFVAGMSTGYSGNLGFPLPHNWAFNQIQTTKLGSGDAALEVDRDAYRPGTDPGTSSVTVSVSMRGR